MLIKALNSKGNIFLKLDYSSNNNESYYILPENLDDSKGQTISTLEGDHDEIKAIDNTNSNINESSSANYSAQFIASLQNIQEIKQGIIGKRGNFIMLLFIEGKRENKYKYKREDALGSENSKTIKQVEYSILDANKQIEEARFQVQKELARLDEDSSDDSILYSDNEKVGPKFILKMRDI